MSTLTHRIGMVFTAAVLAACGTENSSAPLVDANGKHTASWIADHKTYASPSSASCVPCHGADLNGGVSKVSCMSPDAISGFRCHVTSPAIASGCSSCHTTPPAGATAPNRGGAHAKHLALAGIGCSTCHNGSGFGTVNHARSAADGSIAAAAISPLDNGFRAKSVTSFGFNPTNGTCSGIICHGGRQTPSWNSGSIVVASNCLACHEQGSSSQAPQYNSFYSGSAVVAGSNVNLHQLHLVLNDPSASPASTPITCANCHNLTVLSAQHFSGLTTPSFDGTPAATIGGGTTKITAYTPYTASSPSGSCTTACHTIRYWK